MKNAKGHISYEIDPCKIIKDCKVFLYNSMLSWDDVLLNDDAFLSKLKGS